jgi:peptidoglycan/xylan/chitin deacetylase (PgdA/CDA1 family)
VFAGPTTGRTIALTLDDGPDDTVTPGVLQVLRDHGAKATFFILGSRGVSRRRLLEHMVTEGHEVANHMWSERRARTLSVAELEHELLKAREVLEQIGGVPYFRPGSGLLSRNIVAVAEKHNHRCVLGSVYAFDAQVLVPSVTVAGLLRRIRPGSIVILHEGPGRQNVLRVLRNLLPELAARDYRVDTVSNLLGQHG